MDFHRNLFPQPISEGKILYNTNISRTHTTANDGLLGRQTHCKHIETKSATATTIHPPCFFAFSPALQRLELDLSVQAEFKDICNKVTHIHLHAKCIEICAPTHAHAHP